MADLAVLADLKERLNITGTNPTQQPDAYLENCIDRATARVERILGRELDSATFTEYVSGDGTGHLNLRRGPITSVTSVSSIVYDSAGAETPTALDAGTYFVWGDESDWSLPGYIEANSTAWTKGQRNYKVIYVAGYATIPEDIVGVVLDLCVAEINKRRDVASASRDIGGGTLGGFKGEDEIDDEIRHKLAAYIDYRAA